MKTIRKGVFETNSSSTHSICICTDEELEAWQNNEIFWNYGNDFITKEELINHCRQLDIPDTDEEIIEDIIRNPREYDVETYESFGEDYEIDSTDYLTPKGEHINIFCYYGYN